MTATVVEPITGRECGAFISKENSFCKAPVVYECPVSYCFTKRCLAHSPVAKSPKRRVCCYGRLITEGEVQLWKSGNVAAAIALATKQEIKRQLSVISFGLRCERAGNIDEGNVEQALKASGAWAQASERYLVLAKYDVRASAEHVRHAMLSAKHAATCATHAKNWLDERLAPLGKPRTKSRGGLTLLEPLQIGEE